MLISKLSKNILCNKRDKVITWPMILICKVAETLRDPIFLIIISINYIQHSLPLTKQNSLGVGLTPSPPFTDFRFILVIRGNYY